MDGRRFIISLFSSEKAHSITQVVMNLPNDAVEFLGLLSVPQQKNINPSFSLASRLCPQIVAHS